MTANTPPDTDLANIRSRLSDQIAELEGAIRPLQDQLTRSKAQLDLIERALQVGTGVQQATHSTSESAVAKPNVTDRVHDLLTEAGRPLHVSEIRNQYIAKGFTVPGQGNESNLLVYIVRDPRFIRVSKGTYAIAPDGDVPALTIKPKAKKRRRRKAKE